MCKGCPVDVPGVHLRSPGEAEQGLVLATELCSHLLLRAEAAVGLCRARSGAEPGILTYLWCSTAQRSETVMCQSYLSVAYDYCTTSV